MGLRIDHDVAVSEAALCSQPPAPASLAEVDQFKLDLEEARAAIRRNDLQTYRTKLEGRLVELTGQRDKLKDMITAMDAQKVKVAANIYAFNGAIEEIGRCLADIPK